MPLLVQSRFGVDFLRFTEQPGTIWSTTSLPESLRLMGYWISYLGVGYGGELRPYFGDGGVLLFSLPVVLAGLLVPALSLTGFAWTRRHPYAPFALALVLLGLLIMTAGFPEGTPLRRASNFTYNHFLPVQFLRTTYKAGPLVVVGLAVLGRPRRARGCRGRRCWSPLLLLPLVASWPLIRGRGVDDQLLWKQIPAAWQQAADHVDRTAGDGRAVVLPGQLYAYYDWGGTIDPILPVLTEQAGRDPQRRRLRGPARHRPALDRRRARPAAPRAARAAEPAARPAGRAHGARRRRRRPHPQRRRPGRRGRRRARAARPPERRVGRPQPRPRAAGTLGEPVVLPQVRAWDRPGAPGLVRIEAPEPELVLDGSAEGLAALSTPIDASLAGFNYAADTPPPRCAERARS